MQKEIYELKEALLETRKELSHSLYQHEAACLTVRRLTIESDQLRGKLTSTDTLIEQYKENI